MAYLPAEAIRGLTVAYDAAAVTPSDSADNVFIALWVGTAGDVTIVTPRGSTVEFVGVSGLLPVAGVKVMAATTAEDIVALLPA